jgi:hypothetical protein
MLAKRALRGDRSGDRVSRKGKGEEEAVALHLGNALP